MRKSRGSFWHCRMEFPRTMCFTIDAMGRQEGIAGIIGPKGGGYILALKENQPSAYEDIRLYFEQFRKRIPVI